MKWLRQGWAKGASSGFNFLPSQIVDYCHYSEGAGTLHFRDGNGSLASVGRDAKAKALSGFVLINAEFIDVR